MKIALFSDLHGNDVALRAVLESIRRRGADRIICLGDVATLGPAPGFVIDTLRELGCPCIVGNHDAFLIDPALARAYTDVPVVIDAIDWCVDRLSRDQIDYARTFVPEIEIPIDGGGKILLFHGSPRSNTEDILATTPPDTLDAMLDGRVATVMAGGHTHVQMLRQHRGTLLVNPGSLGCPFLEYVGGRMPTILAHAEYAIVDASGGGISVSLERVPLDKGALRASVAASDYPLRGMMLAQYG
jgi:putative phosphoesterase